VSFIQHLEGCLVESPTPAFIAAHIHIGEKVHLDLAHAVTLTGFATTAFDVERKPSLLVTVDTHLRQLRKEVANFVKHLDICDGVAAGSPPDGPLCQ